MGLGSKGAFGASGKVARSVCRCAAYAIPIIHSPSLPYSL